MDQDGKSASEDRWSWSHRVRAHIHKLPLDAVRSLLKTLKLADASFQQTVHDINFENWHENVDTTFLYLHKDLGISAKPTTVPPHFYFQAAQWRCNNLIDMLSRRELSDKSYKETFGGNRNEFEDSVSSIVMPTNVTQLEDEKVLNDLKIAKHYLGQQKRLTHSYVLRRRNLGQQKRLTHSYVLRRHNFYKAAIVNNDKNQHTPSWTNQNTSR
jgi:hypothetical protein